MKPLRWGIAVLALIVILIAAGCWSLGPWTVLRIIGALILGGIVFGTGLFGTICFKARARAWGAGLFALTALCVLGIYWLVF